MKNYFKIIIGFSLIVPLLLVSIVCCCFADMAQADVMNANNAAPMKSDKTESDHCHSDESQDGKHCDCGHVVGIVKNLKIQDFQLTSSLLQNFPKIISANKLAVDLSKDTFFWLRYPLSLKDYQKTVPIYLQISHFLL